MFLQCIMYVYGETRIIQVGIDGTSCANTFIQGTHLYRKAVKEHILLTKSLIVSPVMLYICILVKYVAYSR